MRPVNFLSILFLAPVFALLPLEEAKAQCAGVKVNHTVGTQQVGCTQVTVTSDGSVDVLSPGPCNYGPYWIGRFDSGSYTFTFSTAVLGVTIDVQTLDNLPNLGVEEMVIDVNGAFYPITVPGAVDGCWSPAIIWPPGTVRAPVGGQGSWRDLYIPGPINQIKVANNWVSGAAAGFFINLFVCCNACTTDAGVLNSQPIELCNLDPVNLPPAEQVILDPDDILQYILFTNPGNPLTSTVATSNTPSFTFNPATMTVGTTYYIAAVAGNELNGNVDPTDPCVDESNPITVVWRPSPAVSFFASSTCLVPGECQDVQVFFLGTPPFQLNAQVVQGNNVVATFGGTYTGMDAVEEICLPANTPLGDITIQAISLADAFCACD